MIRLCANVLGAPPSTDAAAAARSGLAAPQPRRMDEIEARVAALLAVQGGIARRRDVLRAGLSRRRLARLLRQGRLRLLTPHLITNVDQPTPDEPLRALAIGLDATVSHGDAALLWGMELATTPQVRSVTVGRDRSRVLRQRARIHRSDLSPGERVERDGLWVTSPVRTVLDLCRCLPLAEAVAAADSALRRGLVTVEELTSAVVALRPGVGRARVAAALRLVDPQCGSVLESLCRVLLHSAGLAPEETQLVVRTAAGLRIGRVDFAWPGARLVVETDGFAFHADRASFRADRRRGNALVLAGWRLLRFSWEDVVHQPDEVVAAVREALTDRSLPHTA